QIVQFEEGDPENPYNWRLVGGSDTQTAIARLLETKLTQRTQAKKLYVAITAVVLTLNSTVSSSITSNAVSYIMADFGIADPIQSFLPTTVYLIGYTFGPLVFSPLSETFGRKVITFWTFNVFLLFSLACALAPNWPALLVFRLIVGTCASVPLTVIGGLYADIFESPRARGRAMIVFMSVSRLRAAENSIKAGWLT
ncbi:MAG: MFS transporter, partial [Rickettsia endosymbiont of Ixodes persulcatus]|nr:MFS transporter [Rickettsia endosymbiont of Ixodes persulcatus]